ncbi:MAG TPA: integration host factor subunit beta [Rhodospirillaceae bacterium]|jgi:integration host factor subunit beta|nr:integration host factor subunit beta [Alphaproteobacteria bacterium]HBH26611.1 integration host factor subunit beta [Rhodospirillaceae bacterium]
MTKSDLVRTLSARFRGLTRADIECAVDTIFEALTQALAAGGRVELRGFGAFSIRERAERMGRNPRTGAKVYVPAKCVPFFRAGKALLSRLNATDA